LESGLRDLLVVPLPGYSVVLLACWSRLARRALLLPALLLPVVRVLLLSLAWYSISLNLCYL